MKKPDFIIIGSMKCGSTSIFNYLIQHPDIDGPKDGEKELHFFDTIQPNNKWYKGYDWYLNRFNNKKIIGEATPSYIHDPDCPKKLNEFAQNDKIKLITIFRDPVDRAYSHYWHCHHSHKRKDNCKSFEEALNFEEDRLDSEKDKYFSGIESSWAYSYFSYKHRGYYAEQLERWYEYFDKDEILVLKLEDLIKNPDLEFRKMCRFIGVKEISLDSYNIYHKNEYQDMFIRTRRQLQEHFKLYNKKLERLTGINWQYD